MALQQGSYLVLPGGPGVPSPPEAPEGLSFPADPLAPAGWQSSGGFLQSPGRPQHPGHLEREKKGRMMREDHFALLLWSLIHFDPLNQFWSFL